MSDDAAATALELRRLVATTGAEAALRGRLEALGADSEGAAELARLVAADVVAAAEAGDAEWLAQLRDQSRALAEAERVRLEDGAWDVLGHVLEALGSFAGAVLKGAVG